MLYCSVRWVKDRFLVCAGSKNVHMVVTSFADVAKYKDSRYLVASSVAMTVLEQLRSVTFLTSQISHLLPQSYLILTG